MKILVINPGATSTKIAVFEEELLLLLEHRDLRAGGAGIDD